MITSHQPAKRDQGRGFAVVIVACALFLALVSCGDAAEDTSADRQPIRVQAESVTGERVIYPDLGDNDTVLWFWAPW